MTQIITIRQQVYEIIKRRIADGSYKHGQRLHEVELAEDLQVSRSPVREVFNQLETEGLLVGVPNRGVYVRSFSQKEISDIFALRDLYECYALDHLAANLSGELIERLREQKELTLNMYGEKNYLMEPEVNFHYTLVQSTGNSFLIDSHHAASAITMSYHGILFAGEHYRENLDAHLAVIEAILAKNFKSAKRALKLHLKDSEAVIRQGMGE